MSAMNNSTMPRVSSLGTCRVWDPLKLLADAGRIELRRPYWGFQHSAAEILQTVRIARGEHPAPSSDIADRVNWSHIPPDTPKRPALLRLSVDSDIVFIELSSVKTYRWESYFTQRNSVATATGLRAPMVDRALLRDPSQDQKDLASDEALEPLQGFTARLQKPDEIIVDLGAAIEALPRARIVLVNHFVLTRSAIPALEIRRELRTLCERVAAKYPDRVTHFDPTPELEARDYPIANPGHYLDEFKPVLAERFATLIGALMQAPPLD